MAHNLLELAPREVCTACTITDAAVSSYLTLSPLLPDSGSGILSVALSVFPGCEFLLTDGKPSC